jgi:hypothetical protein
MPLAEVNLGHHAMAGEKHRHSLYGNFSGCAFMVGRRVKSEIRKGLIENNLDFER